MRHFAHPLLLALSHPDRYRGISDRLAALEYFESLSPQEQAAIQEQRTRSLLEHAYKTSPYYRLVFDEMHFRAVDWHYGQPIPLPELDRELLRANMENLCSRTFRPDELRRFTSSGNPPTAMWRDVEAHRGKAALQYHLNRLSGIAASRIFEIRSAERHPDGTRGPVARIIDERILGRVSADLRNADDESFRNLIHRFNRRKPEVLCGPSSVLSLLSKWLRGSGMAWHRPQRVVTTGETPSPENRQAMAETFGCQVSAQYFCPDVGILAIECPGERLHFHPWASYISLVPASHSGEGSIYRMIVTDLLNYGMPLVRYDSGDCVLFDESPCPCGCWYPSVTAVLGPAIENLVSPNANGPGEMPMPAAPPEPYAEYN